MTITTTILPPQIFQSFSRTLLSDYERWIKPDSITPNPYLISTRKYREYNQLVEAYRALYEWKEAKKENKKAKTENFDARSSFPIDKVNSIRGPLGHYIRQRYGYPSHPKLQPNHEV